MSADRGGMWSFSSQDWWEWVWQHGRDEPTEILFLILMLCSSNTILLISTWSKNAFVFTNWWSLQPIHKDVKFTRYQFTFTRTTLRKYFSTYSVRMIWRFIVLSDNRKTYLHNTQWQYSVAMAVYLDTFFTWMQNCMKATQIWSRPSVAQNRRTTFQDKTRMLCFKQGQLLPHGPGLGIKSLTCPRNRHKTPLTSFTTYVRIMLSSISMEIVYRWKKKLHLSAQNRKAKTPEDGRNGCRYNLTSAKTWPQYRPQRKNMHHYLDVNWPQLEIFVILHIPTSNGL